MTKYKVIQSVKRTFNDIISMIDGMIGMGMLSKGTLKTRRPRSATNLPGI